MRAWPVLLVLAMALPGCFWHSVKTDYGDRMPSFTATDADGQPFDSASLEGHVVVLHLLTADDEKDPHLGLDALKAIAGNLTDVPELRIVTVYRSAETRISATDRWASVRDLYDVPWTVLPDDDNGIRKRVGMGGYGPTYVGMFDQDLRLQAKIGKSSTADDCIHEIARLLHEDPDAEPWRFC